MAMPPIHTRAPTHALRRANFLALLALMRGRGGVGRVLVITPPPVWEPGRKKHQIAVSGQTRDCGVTREEASRIL